MEIIPQGEASAYTYSTILYATSSGHSFSDDWSSFKEKTITVPATSYNKLTYGFNTTLIYEDYAYAYSDGYLHRARIHNDRGYFNGTVVSATTGWSDLEIRHKGSLVKYWNQKAE